MKTHLHLSTRDLDESVAFYRTLLGSEPRKSYGDYALFVTEDPGLELVDLVCVAMLLRIRWQRTYFLENIDKC